MSLIFLSLTNIENYDIADEKTYKKLKTQLFITGSVGVQYDFLDIQIFPYIADEHNPGYPMLPVNSAVEATAVSQHYYYNVADNPTNPSAAGYRASAQEYKYCAITEKPVTDYSPDFTDGKISSVNVKQSNYFNVI